MYHINIIAIGKNKDAWIEQGIEHYLTLLKKSARVSLIIIPDIKNSKNLSTEELKKEEARQLQKSLKSRYRVALSDRGRQMTSENFAVVLQQMMSHSDGCDFIIGGIYGLDDSIMQSAQLILSLSPMTMSHRLIRPVLLEQLYRAFSIISGGQYHK
jgi:23S rRNA (pseudouridine1915-N3)-methyltransferase